MGLESSGTLLLPLPSSFIRRKHILWGRQSTELCRSPRADELQEHAQDPDEPDSSGFAGQKPQQVGGAPAVELPNAAKQSRLWPGPV